MNGVNTSFYIKRKILTVLFRTQISIRITSLVVIEVLLDAADL